MSEATTKDKVDRAGAALDQNAGNAIDAPIKAAIGSQVAVHAHGNSTAVAPANLAQAIEFAQLMARGGPMVGKAFRNHPGACLGIATQAWRWGMDPFSCSQKAYLVGETIGYEAQLVHAILLKNLPMTRRPKFSFDGEGAARTCTVEFFLEGEPEPISHTSPPFGEIQPKNSPLWKSDKDQQHCYFTVRAAGRRHFPDVLMGIYTQEELEAAGAPAGDDEVFTLAGANTAAGAIEPEAQDADFTDVGDQIARQAQEKAAAKPAAEKAAAGAAKASGRKAAPGGEKRPADKPAGDEPKTDTSADAGDSAGGEKRAAEAEEDDAPSDEDIVAGVEAAEKAAERADKGKAIKAAKGALARIAEHGEPDLAKRAQKLRDRYED